jgi:hypothetical protein
MVMISSLLGNLTGKVITTLLVSKYSNFCEMGLLNNAHKVVTCNCNMQRVEKIRGKIHLQPRYEKQTCSLKNNFTRMRA